jgi:hypothetical protein
MGTESITLGRDAAVPERLSAASRRRKDDQSAGQARQFVKGPIPMPWLERAAALPGKAFTVGIVLWFQAGLEGGGRFTVSNRTLSRFKIGRKAAARAYALLSAAGLIDCERGAGRLSRVKLLCPRT